MLTAYCFVDVTTVHYFFRRRNHGPDQKLATNGGGYSLSLMLWSIPKPKTKPPETPKIESALSLTLVPLGDGGIYAVDELDGVVWYVSNGKAVRISALKADFVNEIIPAAEGGAYIHITTGNQNGALWYLKGETATKIHEDASVGQFKENPRLTEKWLWAMWQSERLRRQKEEDKERE